MKTTKLFFMAALALLMTACSSNDDELPQPAGNMITVTAKLAPKSAVTRNMTDNGTDIVVEWAETEQLEIISANGHQATATIESVDGSGTATISFTINAAAKGQNCLIVYPFSAAATTGALDFADNGNLTEQDGTLNANLDVRVGEGTITDDATPALDVTTQPVPQNAIFKFTTQDLSGTDKTATQFKVSDASGNVITTVNLATNPFYVALPVMPVGTYWFNATIDGKPYIAKATTEAVTGTGNFYSSTVKMATIGDVIKADGKFYASGTASAVAKITYIGSETGETSYIHGLALAMSDAGNNFKWKTTRTSADHSYKPATSSFTSESGLQYNATHNTDDYPAFQAAIANSGTAAPSGCSNWFLASGYQWQQMIETAGSLADLRTNAGLQSSNFYWSSSEQDNDYAWACNFGTSGWSSKLKNNDESPRYVRSALAF